MKTGRNAPCQCGSGKKYKLCCLNKQAGMALSQKLLIAVIALIMGAGLIIGVTELTSHQPGEGPGKVWSEEHQHWH